MPLLASRGCVWSACSPKFGSLIVMAAPAADGVLALLCLQQMTAGAAGATDVIITSTAEAGAIASTSPQQISTQTAQAQALRRSMRDWLMSGRSSVGARQHKSAHRICDLTEAFAAVRRLLPRKVRQERRLPPWSPTQRGLKVEVRGVPAWQNDPRATAALHKIDAHVMIADTRGNTGL